MRLLDDGVGQEVLAVGDVDETDGEDDRCRRDGGYCEGDDAAGGVLRLTAASHRADHARRDEHDAAAQREPRRLQA